jgi:orotidine-5'-phosphate decarboxylase
MTKPSLTGQLTIAPCDTPSQIGRHREPGMLKANVGDEVYPGIHYTQARQSSSLTREPQMERDFSILTGDMWKAGKHVCIGLDIDIARIPKHITGDVPARASTFLRAIIQSTADLVAAYKPNTAFFEAWGDKGAQVLHGTIEHINDSAPRVPVIVDAKRADIASSNQGTINFIFEFLKADATTVHPYLGHEAIRPFLDQTNKGIFILCRTSNPGAGEFQDLEISGEPLFLHVASRVARDWNHHKNCGLVVGATYPNELAIIRERVADMPLLIPGIGAQGGDIEAVVRASYADSQLRILINASRSVLYASPDRDFAEAAREKVISMNQEIANVISAVS